MNHSGEATREELIGLYRTMVRIRAFEEAVRRFHVAGKAPGLVHLCTGQEAVPTGFMSVLRAEDSIAIYHRGHGHCIAKGSSMEALLGELLHRQGGLNQGRAGEPHLCDPATRNLGSTGIVGGSVPLAAGAALAAKLRGAEEASVSFFGDGALNQGVLFEVLNMAAIWSLPLVFVCEDNRYGEFTEGAKVTAGARYADRGAMFGIPASQVDGMDVLAVRRAAAEALDRARSGGGPSFLVCETYRFTGHHVSDKQEYKQSEEMAAWQARDPIPNHARWLVEHGHADAEALQRIDGEAEAEVAAAAKEAEAMPEPSAAHLEERVYAG